MDPVTNGITRQLCSWVHNVTLEDIPEDVRERAKYLILDGIACALVGAHLPWSETATQVILEIESPGHCSVIGWEKKIGPLSAALINSSFIQGFELDDWHSEAPLHSNSIILPSLLAAAEQQKSQGDSKAPLVDGNKFLLSYITGLEVGPRIGNALKGSHVLTRGWHSGAVFGPSVSAAATCKMFGLSANLIEDAIGIACTQACGLMSAQFESDVKRMQHGFAARNGLLATFLARKGYVGIKMVLERSYGGFLKMFGSGPGEDPPYLEGEVVKELGSKWQSMGVRVKPYAAMAATHGTVDCIRKLQKEHPEQMKDLSSITSIRYEMGEAAFHHGGWVVKRPLTSTGAQMSCVYVAATQIVDGQVLPPQFRHDQLERDIIWDLTNKTSCHEKKDLPSQWAQIAVIEFKNKPTLKAMVNAPKGVDPAMTNDEIVDKWRMLVRDIIDNERRSRIENFILGLESVQDITELADLLIGVAKSPIA